MKTAKNITELIGNTPLVQLCKISEGSYGNVYGKLEFFNPASSVKDRLGLAMIKDAEEKGVLKEGSVIIEPTSGNTGIALAMVAAVKGYRLIVTMPESASIERRKIMHGFGAELVLTSAENGMKGAIKKAEELCSEIPDSHMLMQFTNPANVDFHKHTTAMEIWEDTAGEIDVFVAGVGTGGTLSGVSEVLKQKNPEIRCVAVEPSDSPVLSGGKPGPHKIQGIGAGFVPANCHTQIIDEVIQVSNEEAIDMTKLLMKTEGILCGISAGANVFAALQLANNPAYKNKNIVTVICDTGERYLSTPLFE